MANTNQLNRGQAVKIVAGVFKGVHGFVTDYRASDNSYLLKEMFPEKQIPSVRWQRNELKPT